MVDRVALHLGSMDLVDVRIYIESHNDKEGSTQDLRSCWDSSEGNRCRRRGEAEVGYKSAYLYHRLYHEDTGTAAEGPMSTCSVQLAEDLEWQALTCRSRADRLWMHWSGQRLQ